MSQTVRKAVIPMAGKGTRFYPLTRTIPKALIALGAKPVIEYVLDEAVSSGLDEIYLIVSPEHALMDQYLKTLQASHTRYNDITFQTIVQVEPLGLGHAIGCAEPYVGHDPFVVLLADDVIVSHVPVALQLIHQYDAYQTSIIGVQAVSKEAVIHYGMIQGKALSDRLTQIESLIEKPALTDVTSELATLGRYLLTHDIFSVIAATRPGALGEIQISDAIHALAQKTTLLAYRFEGKRYDTGTPEGWRQAVIDLL